MDFHGRLSPGVVTSPDTVVELVIHQPANCKDVTIRIWELDNFALDGKARKEGSKDDLLALFTGNIAGGNFKAASKVILGTDPSLAILMLKFRGSDAVYQIPIVSEAGEAEGGSFELGFSIDVGGGEKFRTLSPCFFVPPPLTPQFNHQTHHLDENGKPVDDTEERPLAHLHVCIGVAEGEGQKAKLRILRKAYLDGGGVLVDGPGSEGKPHVALPVRAGRKLYAWLTPQPLEVEGVSDIPVAACVEIPADGRIVRKRAFVRDLTAALPAEYGFTVDDHGKVKLERKVTHPTVARSFGKIPDEAGGYRLDKGKDQ